MYEDRKINIFLYAMHTISRQIGEVLHRQAVNGVFSIRSSPVTGLLDSCREKNIRFTASNPSPAAILTVRKTLRTSKNIGLRLWYRIEGNRRRFYRQRIIKPCILTCRYFTICIISAMNFLELYLGWSSHWNQIGWHRQIRGETSRHKLCASQLNLPPWDLACW